MTLTRTLVLGLIALGGNALLLAALAATGARHDAAPRPAATAAFRLERVVSRDAIDVASRAERAEEAAAPAADDGELARRDPDVANPDGDLVEMAGSAAPARFDAAPADRGEATERIPAALLAAPAALDLPDLPLRSDAALTLAQPLHARPDGIVGGVGTAPPDAARELPPGARVADSGGGSGNGIPAGTGHAPVYDETQVDAPPRTKRCPAPPYPAFARSRQLEAVVTLELVVDHDGGVSRAEVAAIDGDPRFGPIAVDAASGWIYEPAQRLGKAVACRIRQRLRFELRS